MSAHLVRPFSIFALCGFAAFGVRAEAPVVFGTAGGDAWTFEKRIELSVAEEACDEVAIVSPRGIITGRPDHARLVAHVPLAAGINNLEAECRRNGLPNGEPAFQRWTVRVRDAPKANVHVSMAEAEIVLDGGGSAPAPGRAVPIIQYEWRDRGTPAPLGLPAWGPQIALKPPSVEGEYYVTLRTTDALGRSDESTVELRVEGGKAILSDVERDRPVWLANAVVYGIAPTLFGPRGLADVIARLDDIASLGVTVLWLSPVTASPAGDFGYAVTDHFRVRESLGSDADLRTLIAGAHARGMRVILDLVPNHVSDQHAYARDAERLDHGSAYFDFFARTASGGSAHYFNWHNLMNLNYANPEVRRLIVEASAHWVREFDIDGFRVDVAWGPRERAPDFWPLWRRELKRIKPDLLLLAEASARDSYYTHNGFDAAYDWTEALGQWAWEDAFADQRHTASRLRTALQTATAADGGLIFRFLNNNDTGARFVTRYGVARTRVAAAMLLTLPGLPCLYMGDEVGAEFEPYKRTDPISWIDAPGLRPWYERLLALRRSEPALQLDTLRLIDVGEAETVLAYVRPGATEDHSVLVLLNYSDEPAAVELPADVLETSTATHASTVPVNFIDLLGEPGILPGHLRIVLPAHGVRIFKRQRRGSDPTIAD